VKKIIPLAIPDLRGRETEYLARCVDDNWVSSAGPQVTAFEAAVAETAGTQHAVATVNGTAALHLALLVVGVEPGDHVLVPDFTFAATANAVLQAGAIPVFLDITEESWSLDPALIGNAIEAFQPRAIVVVHVLGHAANMDAIRAASGMVTVIEDAAGAIGAKYKSQPVGSQGEAAIFSFNGNKTVTAGGGGALVTDREDWSIRARGLSTQARAGSGYRYHDAGFNYRMPNINAALGLAQLERLDEMLSAKRAIAARYDEAFNGRDDLSPMPRCDWAESACWLYSVRCVGRTEAVDLVSHLQCAGIEARIFWEALAEQDPYADYPSVKTGIAASLSGSVVSLPCSSQLSNNEQGRVIEAVCSWQSDASICAT